VGTSFLIYGTLSKMKRDCGRVREKGDPSGSEDIKREKEKRLTKGKRKGEGGSGILFDI